MSLITVYSLFFDDIRVIAVTVHEDNYFYGLTAVFFSCFVLEVFLASISKEDYFLSFFFWLDAVSTISMLPDIGWVWFSWTGSDQYASAGSSTKGGGASSGSNAAQLAKTSRAGRVTRVIRVIRLIRLIRIVKLYKQAKLAQQKQEEKAKQEAEAKKKRESVMRSNVMRK